MLGKSNGMQDSKSHKRQLAQFGRAFALLFNRAFMYQANHPYILEAIDSTFNMMSRLLKITSPVVFILNREQFFMDDEPLDPRLNVWRIATHFKKTGLESISFYNGATKNELRHFLGITSSFDKYTNAEAMNKAIFVKGINGIKINHVFYKKVTAEEEIISRKVLEEVTPNMLDDAEGKTKQMFLASVVDGVLMEEFSKNFNLENLLKNPKDFSKEMIAADLTTVKQGDNEAQVPGKFLLQQLDVIDHEVEKNVSRKGEKDLANLAEALLDLRQRLAEGLEAQKALGIAYTNEEQIINKANEITDKVYIELIKEEYKGGKIGIPRLAQILCRLIPDANDLKRLLPMIKATLLEDGMSQADFMSLVQELGKELESDELAGTIAKGSEEIGIDSEEIIQEIKDNPDQAAELIYLASEIRNSGGDEKALTTLLVDYLEKVGSKIVHDLHMDKGEKGKVNLQQHMAMVKSTLIGHLGGMDIKDDVLMRLEERINLRMDELLDKMRSEWIGFRSGPSQQESLKPLTVLETLERGVSEDDNLEEILKNIRKKVESMEIDENDFSRIFKEIIRQEQLRKAGRDKKDMSAGIMQTQELMILIDKEIARVRRYDLPFSALGFSLVKAKAKEKSQLVQINNQDIIDALLYELAKIFRDSDVVGEVAKNQMIALLPMTDRTEANLALRRSMRALHLKPIDVRGIPIEIKVAGVAADINIESTTSAPVFVEQLQTQLKNMATRIRNLHQQ
jgi:hypothetical protein